MEPRATDEKNCDHKNMKRVSESLGEATYECPDCGLSRSVERGPTIV